MNTKLQKLKEPKLAQLETGVDKGAMNLAASWYVAMHSKALGKKPKEIELFGRALVAWRDQKDHPVIMERHCSHMGASLAIGKIVDGCLQCPFHHWRYNNSGQCVSIPEVDHIPPKAHQATYIAAERYGYIWVWYGSETPLFPLPEFPASENERHNYMPFHFANKTKATVPRVLENSFDYYHLVTLHNQKVSGPIQFTLHNDQYSPKLNEPPIQKEAWFGVSVELPVNTISSQGGPLGRLIQLLGLNTETLTLRMDAWPSGHRVTGFLDNEESFKMLVCATPVNENNTIREFLLMVKKTGNFLLDIPNYLILSSQSKTTSDEDLPLWYDMKLDMNGVHVKHDFVVLKFRDFYQDWVDKVELVE